MNRLRSVVLLAVVALLAFLAGELYDQSSSAQPPSAHGRKILYYRDPMHPAYRSDKPGTAPDCGMELEPVLEGDAAELAESRAGGAIVVSPEKQQLIDVHIGKVQKTSASYTLHLGGLVAADETRIYRITAAAAGWIQEARPVSTGSVVSNGERLADFYSPEFLGAEQAYVFALRSLDRFQENGKESPDQIALTKANVQQCADTLRNMGMSEPQIEELRHTRQITQRIWMVAPVSGMVLGRNIWPGQRFERGTEFFRIADLSRVWVAADIRDADATFVKPGMRVRIVGRSQQRSLSATVSNVLPQVDPLTRAIKVRLEAENPHYLLRPEMFVDLELPVHRSAAITVPADAVLDSGERQTVFVSLGNGIFKPRLVRTGERFGDRVEIIDGLKSGEEIVVSGNFLLDSESRMRIPAADGVVANETDRLANSEKRK